MEKLESISTEEKVKEILNLKNELTHLNTNSSKEKTTLKKETNASVNWLRKVNRTRKKQRMLRSLLNLLLKHKVDFAYSARWINGEKSEGKG